MIDHLSIFATTRCNLDCVHCMIDFPKKPEDFPLDVLNRLMDESRVYGVQRVGLSGGEACLHPEFDEMIALIVKKGYTWSYVSNGILIAPYLRAARAYPDSLEHITISLDGANAETHDAVRARKGAFDLTIASVKRYIAEEIPVMLPITLNSKNKDQIAAYISLAENLGVGRVSFGGMIPTPRNTSLAISEQELLELYQETQQCKENTGIHIRTTSSLHTRGGIDFCKALHFRHNMMFNTHGELLFCCDSQQDGAIIGSIHNESLPDLIDKWLNMSAEIQSNRTKLITKGQMTEGFDTCRFCNQYFS